MDLKPGRELDALIAEKVMGCDIRKPYDDGRSKRGMHYCACPGAIHMDTNDEGSSTWLKEYSSDIAAAWEVVEKLRDHLSDFKIELIASDVIGEYEAAIEWIDNEGLRHGMFYMLSKNSPAHAICLAALKALESEK